MSVVPGYKIIENIAEGGSSVIFRAVNQSTGQRVVLKVLKGEFPSPTAIARLRDEFNTIKHLKSDNIVGADEFLEYRDGIAIVLEDFSSVSLDQWLSAVPFNLDSFLDVAIQIVDAIRTIHKAGILHGDIKPSNILIEPSSRTIKITDFGLSTFLSFTGDFGGPEGSYAYIAPERTGRVSRHTDHRSDLYSTGVTLYRMFTGRLPFSFNDIIELIHAHLALLPENPLSINPSLPPVVGRIIMRLLEKNQEDRYQSSDGLFHDLRKCQESLRLNGQIEDFQEGLEDHTGKLVISEKLYGREEELIRIEKVMDEIRLGQRRLLLINGEPGMGKTALINEVRKRFIGKQGFFVQGKFDINTQTISFSAIRVAIGELIQRLLFWSSNAVEGWKSKIMSLPGSAANVLLRTFPDLGRIIEGQSGAPTDLPPGEMLNRLSFAFRSFIGIFSKPETPFVLVLDDMQWADAGSFQLITDLMLDSNLTNFLLVVAYRTSEVGRDHPLQQLVMTAEQNGVPATSVDLKKLNAMEIESFLSDTFPRTDHERLIELAVLLEDRSAGIPLSIHIMVNNLYENGIIHFENNGWLWDPNEVEKVRIDSDLQLILDGLNKLPNSTIRLLKNCSAMGSLFSIPVLSAQTGQTIDVIYQLLKPSIEQGFIIMREGDSVIFSHDRIREALYNSIEPGDRDGLHYALGRAMASADVLHSNNFDFFLMVEQLNLGSSMIFEETEKLDLARMNLEAGERALNTASFDRASHYVRKGIALTTEKNWTVHYPLMLELHRILAQAGFQLGDMDGALEILQDTLARCKTRMDRVRIYEMKVLALNARSRYGDGIREAGKALALLGIRLPTKVNPIRFMTDILSTNWKLSRVGITNLVGWKRMENAEKMVAMRLLMTVYTPAYIHQPELAPVIALKMVNLSLKYGNSPESPFAYVVIAILLGSGFKEYKRSYDMGRVAVELAEKPESETLRCKVFFLYSVMIHHWSRSTEEGHELLMRGYKSGLVTGDFIFVSYCLNHIHIQPMLLGKPLEELSTSFRTYGEIQNRLNVTSSQLWFEMLQQIVENLRNPDKVPTDFNGDKFDEREFVRFAIENQDQTILAGYYLEKSLMHLLCDEPGLAFRYVREARKYSGGVMGMMFLPYIDFIFAISMLMMGRVTAWQWRKIKKISKNFKLWATNSPTNYGILSSILQAEIASAGNRKIEAAYFYGEAVDRGSELNTFMASAIAAYRAARFHETLGGRVISRAYYKIARYAFQRMGASAIIGHLDGISENFRASRGNPLGVRRGMEKKEGDDSSSSSSSTSLQTVDLETILRASRTMSESLLLDQLLSSIMKILMENAGAQRGFLIMIRDGIPYIEAGESYKGEAIPILKSIPVENSNLVSPSIVRYVSHTEETVILKDATKEGVFTEAPYILSKKPKSILCMQVVKKANLHVVLYLENNLTVGAFSFDRISVITMLSAQAAISLENSMLYEEMKSMNKNLELRVSEEIDRRRSQEQLLIQQSKLSSMGEMIVSISHHWRQPLNVLSLQLSILEDLVEDPTEEKEAIQESIITSQFTIQKMSDVLDDFAGSFRRSEDPVRFDAVRALCDTLHLFIPEVRSNHVYIYMNGKEAITEEDCRISIPVSRYVNGYPNEFKHVIANILQNAKNKIMDHRNESGGAELDGRIDIRLLTDEESFHLQIEDNGGGISDANKNRIYEPYFTSDPHRGKGLGLFTAKIIVEQNMNGNLYHGIGKRGAIFHIVLPPAK